MLVRETVEVLLLLLTLLRAMPRLSLVWSAGDLAVLERMPWGSMLRCLTSQTGLITRCPT